MASRITGFSGMDIEGLVGNLMKAEQAKVDKLYKQRTLLTWKQEAYKKMASSLTSFQDKFFKSTNFVDNMKYSAFYTLKNFSITNKNGDDSKAVTIKNTSLTKNVEHKLEILKLAQAEKMTGTPAGQSGYTKKIVSENPIDVNSLTDDMTISLNLDGKVLKADLEGLEAAFATMSSDDDKLNWVVNKLNGQFAAFGTGSNVSGGPKVQVSADTSTKKLTFATEAGRSLTVSSFSNGYDAGTSFTYDKTNTGDKVSFELNVNGATPPVKIEVSTLEYEEDGTTPKLDENSNPIHVTSEVLAERINAELLDKGINTKVDDTLTENFAASVSGGSIKLTAKSETVRYTLDNGSWFDSDDEPIELYGKTTSEFGVASGASTDNTAAMTVGSMFAGVDLSAAKINDKSLASMGIDSTTTIKSMIDIINKENPNLTLSYNSVNGSFTMQAKNTGEANGFSFDEGGVAMNMFGFSTDADAIASGKYVEAQDAEYKVDGVKTTRESNDVKIGDLSVTLNQVTAAGEEITIKSSSDTDTVINKIKEFVTSYNELLKSFTTAYNETRAKSGSYGYYEPLTDEEKSALSEKDVELWEEKAKQGILSRDGTVSRVVDQLRNAMSQPIIIDDGSKDGKKFSLYDIGIASTDWKDMGALTIDEDKLRKALEENPEYVEALFSRESKETYYGDRKIRDAENGIIIRLDDIVRDATRTSAHPKTKTYGYFVELAGSETINMFGNSMYTSLKEINQKIVDLEALNLSKENSYYNMFSKMEQAMTKAQNQMNLAGMS